MTDSDTASPILSELPSSARIDGIDPPWRARPAIMAAICAVAGFIFYHLVESTNGDTVEASFAAFVAVATILFVLTAEVRRLHWALLFALGWGAVIGLIAENNRGYNVSGSPFEWPFWSGLLAVAVAAPLFQTWRDVAAGPRDWRWWQLPYDRLHMHAWTDAVIGAGAGIFVGISMALAALIAGLFSLIGIEWFSDLMQEGWFVMALVGAAFGGAVGLLRERDKLVATLQRLVMVVLAVLAPVLAAALSLFLLAMIGTGLEKLWESGFSTAAMMLGASAFAVLLTNAVIGNGAEDRANNPLLRGAAAVLAVAVLPLAVIALMAMMMRIGQYGWTPERMWGVIAVIVALGYGLAGLWSVVRGRRDFDDLVRPLQQKLAIGLMLVATFLALPIVDFGAISTRDQLARLESGAVKPERFDWAAMAFDFGPDGRTALERIAKSTNKKRADAAKIALAAKSRWDLNNDSDGEMLDPIDQRVRVIPADRPLTPEILVQLGSEGLCREPTCIVMWRGEDRLAIIGRYRNGGDLESFWLKRGKDGKEWVRSYGSQDEARESREDDTDLKKAVVTIEPVTMQQLTVDGKPVGVPFKE
jgi:hypothetical protein